MSNAKILIPFTAAIFLLNPASYIVKTIVSKWAPENNSQLQTDTKSIKESLDNAGQLIGIMERILVLIFVFIGNWEGVGFLLAAKSVFRFGDLKEAKNMKITEYVLIGTLLSFGIAIITSVIATKLLCE